MYQVWFTENVTPLLTTTERATYRTMVSNQKLRVGSIVDGRQLLRALTKDVAALITFLDNLGKSTIVCDVRDIKGVRYGYEQVEAGLDADQVMQYVIQPVAGLTAYPINEVEYDKYMQPIILDELAIPPAPNTSFGWECWSKRL